ncbi:MAG: hypothetical protein WDW36_000457 [Sanguina aurantia]
MPALSPTMSHGNIATWLVKEGDPVTAGTMLADIETDKAVMGFENQDEGFVARLLAPSGAQNVPVGTPVAVLVEEASDIAAFANWSPASATEPSTTPSSSTTSSSVTAAAPPAAVAVAAPPPRPRQEVNGRLGPAARLLLQAAGLQPHDIPPSGPRSIVTKGDVLAALALNPSRCTTRSPPPPLPTQPLPLPPAATPPNPAPSKPAVHTPPAAAAAAAPKPPASGPFVPRAAVPLVPGGVYVDNPNSQIRRVIASRLLESKVTIPAMYVTATAPLDAVQALRSELASQGIKVSVNDCVLKAIALALKAVPEANAYYDEASGSGIQFPGGIDICVAVATERGLITPIVKAVAGRSLSEISSEVKSLAGRARENKLRPEEFMGGSFTVSNLGMFGVSDFCAIINPPQAAILAVGGPQQRVSLAPDGTLSSSTHMAVTLTVDQRVIDGEMAAELLAKFSEFMAAPVRLMM